MTLRLYDSATRQVRDFVPLVEGRVGMYVCGATPQASPHVGHVRSQLAFDVLRRWLVRQGNEVTYIRNVTDIDDKILEKSQAAGVPWWAHAYRYEREFTAAYDLLNVLPTTYEPRATGHIVEMVELVATLLERGHAYRAADGCGDVYFDVHSLPAYGELTHQKPADLEPADDADPGAGGTPRKKDPRDFALWKAAKPTEPQTASWPAPWGRGRPGWHLECSAMARRYLGAEFDIHGGGLDLRFPHHENERAQSLGAGDGFARYWLHNAWVVMAGEKMSKSLGNVLSIATLTEQVRPVVLRFALSAPHYRSNIELSGESLEEATTSYERIETFVVRAAEQDASVLATPLAGVALPAAYEAALDDDLGTPAGVAVLHDTVRAGNSALAAGRVADAAGAALQVRAMADVLGVDPLDPHWATGSGENRLRDALDHLVRAALDERQEARKTRDWARADALRDRLVRAGIAVEDTAEGARWTLQRPDPADPHELGDN